jgi:hypothetical protein
VPVTMRQARYRGGYRSVSAQTHTRTCSSISEREFWIAVIPLSIESDGDGGMEAVTSCSTPMPAQPCGT